ncbi:hypothetical protein [Longimicrobium terrae]|uniref:Uncharacterized protein n=1 Tax=Longimicrobium terrae TaxID=1639882 RepID=A0A841GXB4_9BACT|nr:hypothetical protein [Longimicrobium terrae]MBB4635432.1 hypothetical protein [Longimicrobium terrae]MBB6069826.1 hypothetical protein [Longimicrobium terrae]NNC30968.1 hypothetical protein [Longimicrobium terrae]NNC32746.1 hypothetical protein [Longimicrobium terrae]
MTPVPDIDWTPELILGLGFFLGGCLAGWRNRLTLRASVVDRIDLRPGQSPYRDASFFWQRDVLQPRNYRDGRGAYWIRRWVLLMLVQLDCWLIAFMLFSPVVS